MTKTNFSEFKKALMRASPVKCEFKIGDRVRFTNDSGVAFSNLEIIGFAEDDSFYGRYIYLNTSSYWFPVHPDFLTLELAEVSLLPAGTDKNSHL